MRDVVARRKARLARPFAVERAALRPLPERRAADFVETEARVTRASTCTVRGILSSAPSRLIGHRLEIRLSHDRLDGDRGASLVLSVARGQVAPGKRRGRVIDYRRLSEGLERKPQAFKGLACRDALFPGEVYRRTWAALEARLPARPACRTMVGLLELAARQAGEAELAEAREAWLARSALPDLDALGLRFQPMPAEPPSLDVPLPAIARYDALIGAAPVP